MKDDFADKKKKIEEIFTKEELVNCRKELDKFKQKERTYLKPTGEKYTRLISTLELYMETLGVIRFDETGHKWVRDPMGYDRLSKMEAKLDLWDWHRMQEDFERNPAAKQAHLDYITEIGKKMRGLKDKFRA